MKALQGCLLVLLIIILIPIAASCAGISLFAIGTTTIVTQAIDALPTVPPDQGGDTPGGQAPVVPTFDARIWDAQRGIEERHDAATTVADEACVAAAGDDLGAYDRCLLAFERRLADYDALLACFARTSDLAATRRCEDEH